MFDHYFLWRLSAQQIWFGFDKQSLPENIIKTLYVINSVIIIFIAEKVEHNFTMNKNKSIERKITLQSSDQSESNPRVGPKNSGNRISSIKSLSFKDIPFSQHIFCEEPPYELKVSSATNFNPERWNFEPRWDILGKEFEDKSKQLEAKNHFFQARMVSINKNKEKKCLQKRQSVIEEVDHGILDELVTFRTVKKRVNKNQQKEQIKALI